MVDFWACIGLACIDDKFLNALRNFGDKTLGEVVREYGFRLSCFEIAALERILGIDEAVELMQKFRIIGCPPPPRPCPFVHFASLSAHPPEYYAEYRKKYRAFVEMLYE